MPLKLSPVAETQLATIMYAFGCTVSQAISHALESQHAFETLTDDQILNWLDDQHKEALKDYLQREKDGLSKIPGN